MLAGVKSTAGRGIAALCLALLFVTGCAGPTRLAGVPQGYTTQAELKVGPIRFWPGADPAPLKAEAHAAIQRAIAWRASHNITGPLPPSEFLAISGGGDDGAFGAGLMNGWTQHGDRPNFQLVTGVSTGALIAPFAFLGPRYDAALKAQYTGVTQRDIFRRRPLFAALFSDGMADTGPLANRINAIITRPFLDEIAAEYAKGRLLLIGTTDLDSLRGVIWNMGAIASSKDPRAIDLFRKVILASASIPAVFPPVMIDVTVDGRRYQEMHVDGGVTNQVFLYPEDFDLSAASEKMRVKRERRVWIIRNGRLDPDWATVDRRTLRIAGRSVTALIQNQSIGDISRIYLTTMRDNIDYNLAFIPADFNVVKTRDFDPAYMRPLYERGFEMAAHGYPWLKAPPAFAGAPVEIEAQETK